MIVPGTRRCHAEHCHPERREGSAFSFALAALLLIPVVATAQLTPGPPVRRVSTASAVSTEQIGQISAVRQLPDGRVLLNDGQRRRLLLLDTNLKVVEVVLDSLSETANFYGTRTAGLIPWRSDSTLFVDPASYAMLVIDPQARITRTRAVPPIQNLGQLGGTSNGTPGVDAKGRLVYRVYAEAAPPKVAPPPGTPWFPQEADSAFIVGMDIDTRKVDTLGVIRIPKVENSVTIGREGGWNFNSVTNPLPSTDEWAVLPDGSIGFVRGRDYRVEWRDGEGKLTSSQKLPYPWVRLTEEAKQKLVDSVRAVQTRQAMNGYMTQLIRWVNQWGNEYPKDLVVPKDYNVQQGLQKSWRLPPGMSFPAKYIYGCAPGEEPVMIGGDSTAVPPVAAPPQRPMDGPPGPPGAMRGTPSCIPGPVTIPGGNSPPMPQLRTAGVMAPEDLPDYKPPFAQNAVRADGDGNLWVRINTPTPIPGGPIYDVINRQGELVDRIQIPFGFQLVGFGAGKIVYLSSRDASGVHLARVRLK